MDTNGFLKGFSRRIGSTVIPFKMKIDKNDSGPKFRYIIDGVPFRVVCSVCEREQELDLNLRVKDPCPNCGAKTFVRQGVTSVSLS